MAAARNRGIEAASGELITFCDADDLWFAEHLAALLDVWDRHGGIATSNCYWLFPRGIHPSRTRYKGRFPEPSRQRRAILEQNFVSTMSIFPRALVDEIGPFDEERRARRGLGLLAARDLRGPPRLAPAGAARALPVGRRRASPPAGARWMRTSRRSSTGSRSGSRSPTTSAPTCSGAARDPARARSGARATRRCGTGATPRRPAPTGEAAGLCPAERPLVWKARVLEPRAAARRAARAQASAPDRATGRLRRRTRPVSAAEDVFHVVFICTGNRFRSVLAEHRLRQATSGLPVRRLVARHARRLRHTGTRGRGRARLRSRLRPRRAPVAHAPR